MAARSGKETRPGDRYLDDPRIPDKQYFRIGEVSTIAGVEAYVLRFWESEFPMLRPAKKKSSGQRSYARSDVALVLRIRDLLYEQGFTIPGARKQLEEGGPEPAAVPARTREVLEQIRNEVQELLRLVRE